jgi:hypothetical protein
MIRWLFWNTNTGTKTETETKKNIEVQTDDAVIIHETSPFAEDIKRFNRSTLKKPLLVDKEQDKPNSIIDELRLKLQSRRKCIV